MFVRMSYIRELFDSYSSDSSELLDRNANPIFPLPVDAIPLRPIRH